ncbi:MAG: hypothetical protein ACSHWW_04120 [Nonlabens sp.]|uniref:hypothetical protein n=1 Tax=Nonlabens sp. TaxID=1888209 RepID=UPI003EF2EB1D
MKSLNMCLCALMLLCTISCEKDDDSNCQGIDCLPPITQTGAGTFGCLVNGEPFVNNSGNFNCFYQLVDGEYTFGITARDEVLGLRQINLGSIEKEITPLIFNDLNDFTSNEFYAEISYNNQTTGAFTTQGNDGTIKFNRLDTTNNIMSAEFSFIIIDENGFSYNITNGRFDSTFTQ